MLVSRRDFIRAACVASSACLLPRVVLGQGPEDEIRHLSAFPSLKTAAARAGIHYGAAVSTKVLRTNKDFAAAVARECNLIVPEWELQCPVVRPSPHTWNFSQPNRLLDFADSHAMKMRGTSLVWHYNISGWFAASLRDNPRKVLENYIYTVAGHYKGRLVSWDVVNEAIHPKDGLDNGLRKSPWLEALGPSYIETAFQLAAEADPDAKLIYNDYGAEYNDDGKADLILALLRDLQDKDVPIHGVGIQGHLNTDARADRGKLTEFCKNVRRMGLELLITELDVRDTGPSGDPKRRDRMVADHTKDFLESVLSVIKPAEILTWGLSDRYTWLDRVSDDPFYGQFTHPARCLPLDADNRRKPMWHVLYDCLRQMA